VLSWRSARYFWGAYSRFVLLEHFWWYQCGFVLLLLLKLNIFLGFDLFNAFYLKRALFALFFIGFVECHLPFFLKPILRQLCGQKFKNLGALNRIKQLNLPLFRIKRFQAHLHSTQYSSLQQLWSWRPHLFLYNQAHSDQISQLVWIHLRNIFVFAFDDFAVQAGEVSTFKRHSERTHLI